MNIDQQIAQGLLQVFIASGKFPEFQKLLNPTGNLNATKEMVNQGKTICDLLEFMKEEADRLTTIAKWALQLNLPIKP